MRKNKPRDISQDSNPFYNGMRIPIKLLEKVEVFDDLSQTEIYKDAIVSFRGDSVSKTKRIVVEKEKSVSLQLSYCGVDRTDVFENLCSGAKDMFVHIAVNIGRNKTLFYLDRISYMSRYGIKSQTTFISHRNDLISSGIISLSTKTNWLWVNPMYIFNGIRSQFFKEYCYVEDTIKLKG